MSTQQVPSHPLSRDLSHGPSVAFDSALISRYDRSGPRYTSYPTALQFHNRFGPSEYRDAAAECNRSPTSPLSLYVHVPFCASPCFYCGCNKIITHDQRKAQRYLDYLAREIALQAPLFDRRHRIEQLHFGGGTPTFLSTEQISSLFDTLRQSFSLADADDREYSIEIDPRTLSANTLGELASLGFNRLSLGVQDVDPAVQQAINRIQPIDSTLHAIATAREHGFDSISVDLIYGLPKQTLQSFARTLDLIINAKPDRLAVYGYAHMPRLFKAQRHINEADLPSSATRVELLGLTISKLTAAGYVYIGMDHFALPNDELSQALVSGHLHRNFQGYSTRADCDLVALGVSSIGKIGSSYAQNAKTLHEYYAALDAEQLPIQRGLQLSNDDQVRRAVIQALMCQNGLDKPLLESLHKICFDDYFANELEQLVEFAKDGLVQLSDRDIRVTASGRVLLRNIAMVFDAYLPKTSAASFSNAI